MFRIQKIAVLMLVFALLLAACGGSSASEPAASEAVAAAPAAVAEAVGEALTGQHTYVIVPAESRATYLIDEEFFGGALAKLGIESGEVDVVGNTQEIEGQLQLNFDDLNKALGDNSFTVKMNTFVTNQDRRDKWIRENGPRFNDYPLAIFKATAIEGAPASYKTGDEVSFKLSGDLTIREISKPVTFDVKAKIVGNTLTGTATTRLKMSEFGIDPPNFANTLTVADEFGMEVAITAREK